MNTHVSVQTKPAAKSVIPPVRSNLLQRKCACGGKVGPMGECEQCRKEREAKAPADVPPIVHDVLRSSGQPLDPATRAFMELRFGHDFSHVRVHNDEKAADSARAVHAHAYTVGKDVVFGENRYAPTTHSGRELLAHELAHAVQQRLGNGAPPFSDPSGIFESSAAAAGRRIANGGVFSRNLPACGIGLARAPVSPDVFDDKQLAEEIKRETEKLKPGEEPGWWLQALRSEEWTRARIRRDRAEQDAAERQRAEKDAAAERQRAEKAAAAERERKERAAAVAEAEAAAAEIDRGLKDEDADEEFEPTPMALGGKTPAKPVPRKPARRKTPTPSKFSPGGFTDKDIYGETDEAMKRLDERLAKEREIAKTPYKDRLQTVRVKLQAESGSWYSRNEAFSKMTGEEVWRKGVSEGLFCESEKQAVYEDQNSRQQYILEALEEDRKRARAKFESDQYQAWVAQGDQLRAPQTIIQPFVVAAAAPELVAAAYFGAQSGEMVGNMVNACRHGSKAECAAASAQVATAVALHVVAGGKPGAGPKPEGGEPLLAGDPNLTFRRGTDVTNRGAFQAPDVVTPSRPVAGFARDIEPKPAPVVVPPGGSVSRQMPPARVVQGNQPTYGAVTPAIETPAAVPAAKPSPRVTGFRSPPKDVAEKPGLIEVETGPREYVKKEYLGDVGAAGEQQSRYHVNVQLDQRGMMDADFVLRGGGKRSGSLFGKDEFLAAKQHFEQQNGAGSVKGAYGRWGGGDNLDTFNTRYKVATDKGLPHDEAMIEAARKTKTGEWARAAGFNDVKITKAEGSPGAYTNVEVEFTK
jgi:hypothetical protein